MRSTRSIPFTLLMILSLALLIGCGAVPVSMDTIPAYPDAAPLVAGENEFVDEMVRVIRESSAQEGVSVEFELYALPDGTTWEQIEGFYSGQLADDGWEAAPDMSQDIEFFRSVGWSRGSGAREQALVVGHIIDVMGEGAFLMVGLFSE